MTHLIKCDISAFISRADLGAPKERRKTIRADVSNEDRTYTFGALDERGYANFVPEKDAIESLAEPESDP